MPQELKHKQENNFKENSQDVLQFLTLTLFLFLVTDLININTNLTKVSKQEHHNFLRT